MEALRTRRVFGCTGRSARRCPGLGVRGTLRSRTSGRYRPPAVRSVVGARPKVERGALPSASCGCRSARVDRAGFGFEERSSGAGWTSTPANFRGLQRSWSKAESACEGAPPQKLQKQRAVPTRCHPNSHRRTSISPRPPPSPARTSL